jgi:type IV pilus assembly protein PilF
VDIYILKVTNVLRLLRIGLIIFCTMLQSCGHEQDNEAPPKKRADLSKAASYNMQLGLGYLEQGDRSRAKKKLLIALKQEPQSPDVSAAMAYYFEKSSSFDDARQYYLKAISLSANAGAQLNNYGTFLCRQGEYKKAETYFMKAVSDMNYIHTAGAYENAGLCALAVPDDAKAKLYFINALKQDPSKRESLYELVKLESKAGQDDEALKHLQKYPEVVLNDKVFLTLAKDLAHKVDQQELALNYEHLLNKMNPSGDIIGAEHEYNNHNG